MKSENWKKVADASSLAVGHMDALDRAVAHERLQARRCAEGMERVGQQRSKQERLRIRREQRPVLAWLKKVISRRSLPRVCNIKGCDCIGADIRKAFEQLDAATRAPRARKGQTPWEMTKPARVVMSKTSTAMIRSTRDPQRATSKDAPASPSRPESPQKSDASAFPARARRGR